MRIDLSCAVCGRNRFSLTDATSDGSIVSCEDCGHEIGTMGDLKQKTAEEVMRRAEKRH